jgi:uncharacterized membrane protein YfcA
VFGVVGLPAAWLGTILNHRVSQPTLLLAFAGLALVAAAAMLLHARATRRTAEHADQDASPDHDRAETVADEHRDASQTSEAGAGGAGVSVAVRTRGAHAGSLMVTAAKVALGGAAVGFLTGFLGVGGGFLVVPALVIMLRMPITLAIGTSLLIIALNSVSSMVSRIGVAYLDWRIIVPFTLGAVVGTLAGKRLADRLSGRTLGIAFAWLLIAVGLFVGIQNLLVI